jgi:hypothetical protein
MSQEKRYRWAQWGDLNAFFGLMLDNVTNLVVLTGILVGVFGYPSDKVYTLMIPGTALGVLFGDAVYTWFAFRASTLHPLSELRRRCSDPYTSKQRTPCSPGKWAWPRS